MEYKVLMRTKIILACFWIMWSGTQVTKNQKGGWTYTGGLCIESQCETIDMNPVNVKPGVTLWRKSGGYHDTKVECEWEAKRFTKQNVLCLPNGILPITR